MKTFIKLFLICTCISFGSCSKKDDTPDPMTTMVDKWWCDSNNTVSSQYFKSDGTWEQGEKNGGANNDKGKWSMSPDKKKIFITNVTSKVHLFTNWEYDFISSSSTNLELNFTAINVKMS